MQIPITLPQMPRELFPELELATRLEGRFGTFVAISKGGEFAGKYVKNAELKIRTRPLSINGGPDDVTTLEMLGELFMMFGYFPSTAPTLTDHDHADLRDALVVIRARALELAQEHRSWTAQQVQSTCTNIGNMADLVERVVRKQGLL